MYSVILLNGGLGSRVGADVPKQLVRIKGVPIFIYSLRVMDKIDEVNEVIINYPHGWKAEIEEIVAKYAIKNPVKYIEAGKSRQDSVRKMLSLVSNGHVLIHEAARPLVIEDDFMELIRCPLDNVTQALRLPFSVLSVDAKHGKIAGILDRDSVINVQLPQKFLVSDLKIAHDSAVACGKSFTEDAAMIFDIDKEVAFVFGHEKNFKITTSQDVFFAEHMMNQFSESFDE